MPPNRQLAALTFLGPDIPLAVPLPRVSFNPGPLLLVIRSLKRLLLFLSAPKVGTPCVRIPFPVSRQLHPTVHRYRCHPDMSDLRPQLPLWNCIYSESL